jgi:hypothetical protein
MELSGVSEPKPFQKWGFTSKTKWAVVEIAPFTASGLNEVLATARTKAEAARFARVLGIIPGNTRYQIINAKDIKGK